MWVVASEFHARCLAYDNYKTELLLPMVRCGLFVLIRFAKPAVGETLPAPGFFGLGHRGDRIASPAVRDENHVVEFAPAHLADDVIDRVPEPLSPWIIAVTKPGSFKVIAR